MSGQNDITNDCTFQLLQSNPFAYKLIVPHNLVTDKLTIDVKTQSELAMKTNFPEEVQLGQRTINVNVLANKNEITLNQDQEYEFNIDLNDYDFETGEINKPGQYGAFWIGDTNPSDPAQAQYTDVSITMINPDGSEVELRQGDTAQDKTFQIFTRSMVVYHYEAIVENENTKINIKFKLKEQVENVRFCYLPVFFGG